MTDGTASARGAGGLYETVYSSDVELTILNPCRNTTVNDDTGLVITEVNVPVGKTELLLSYKGPSDSMSVLYGNGYDKCGPMRYTYLNFNGGGEFTLDVFS